MSKSFAARFSLLMAGIVISSCGGGGGAESLPLPPPPVTAEVRTVTVSTFPHQVDIYSVASATRAIVFLHGGGGRNFRMAFELGINLVNARPTAATTNAAWLTENEFVAVFPQGQATMANPLANTWNNYAMDSGQDDVGFLQALTAYIRSEYGLNDVYLVGHSNGGMMVNRVWCESPDTFRAYISLAGPASSFYLGTLCVPTSIKPYYGLVGDQDQVLQVTGNWEQATWEVAPLLATDFINPILIGEWQQHIYRSQLMCGEVPVLANAMTENAVETWGNCGDRLRMQRLLNAGHMIDSLEQQTAGQLLDAIAAHINLIETL